MRNRWRVYGCAMVMLLVGVNCGKESPEKFSRANVAVESEVDFGAPESAEAAAEPQMAPGADDAPSSNSDAPLNSSGETDAEGSEKTAPLLIYNGTIQLAIYDVAATQKKIVTLVESEGGWISSRSSMQMILRVPAPQFRAMLDLVAGKGDVIDMSWEAEDVTAVVNDTRIRLDSALAMRQRLQELLVRAKDVKDALAIEEQLSRVILEIEQLQASLRGYKDRIAYSTITVEFRAKTDREIPDDEFSLPFAWLDELGAQRLLNIPRL